MLLIIIPLAILVFMGGLVIFMKGKTEKKIVNPQIKQEEKIAKEISLLLWKDPLGFEFKYPKGLKLNPHEEDQDNYAHIELTSKDHEGGIIVWSKDLLYKDLTDYLENDEEASGASVMETTLDQVPAKKLLVKTKEGSKIITVTIYDELLFLIEVNLDKEKFWQKPYDRLVSTFSFGTVAGVVSNPSEDTSGEAGNEEIQGEFEGEEIIE